MQTDKEQENEESNPARITLARTREDRECDRSLAQTIWKQQHSQDNEGLGVAPTQRSTQPHAGSTTMTNDKNCHPMTKGNRTHMQVTEFDLTAKEKINPKQQHHNIDSLNGTELDCDVNKVQTLVDVMCNVNQTFQAEENFANHGRRAGLIVKKRNANNNTHSNVH